MRSKKWHAFSTSVPPVLRLKRFQSPTFTRNGKRCSRIATMWTLPAVPAFTSSISRAIGGMYRYSRPTHTTPGWP